MTPETIAQDSVGAVLRPIKLSQLIQSCGHDPLAPKGPQNTYGTGHMLHVGYKVMCKGVFDKDGEPVPDSRHLIGELTAVPDAGADVVPTERADEGTWELDPSQTGMDPANPVCQVCGQPPVL